MTPRCGICGALEGQPHDQVRHKAFADLRDAETTSQPFSAAKRVRQGLHPESGKKREPQHGSGGRRR